MKAFRSIEKITDTTIFISQDVRTVLREGMAAARHREFLILDSPPGVGTTTALEALKQVARHEKDLVLVELTPNEVVSTPQLWQSLLVGLGAKKVWTWTDRRNALMQKLMDLARSKVSPLIVVDDAVILPPRCWWILKHISSLHREGLRCGAGVVVSAPLNSSSMLRKFSWKLKIAKDKGSYTIQTLGEVLSSADRIGLSGLTPDEIKRFIDFQAKRDGVQFAPDFVAEIERALASPSNQAFGTGNRPANINNTAKAIARRRHDLGKPITETVKVHKAEREKAPVS